MQVGAPCKVGSLWGGWWHWWPWGPPSLALPKASPPGPTSKASHLLPECTVVTVVGLGLRSAPTPGTPDEEEMKLQSVEGARPAGESGHKDSNFRRKYSPFLWQGFVQGPKFSTLGPKRLPIRRKAIAMCSECFLSRPNSSLLFSLYLSLLCV